MFVKTFVYPELAIQSYLIGDEKSKKCIVIDPPRLIGPIREYVNSQGLHVEAVLETHVHADFISGALEMKKTFGSSLQICCSAAAGQEWLPKYADRGVIEGDIIALGQIVLKALHTPGHTPEHLSWLCYEDGSDTPVLAFTGDFLFVQGVGRPDLLGEDMKQNLLNELYRSLFTRIAQLPDALTILPSHGAGSMCGKAIGHRPTSTLGEERRLNSAFMKIDEKSWMAEIQKDMPIPPKTFARNRKINLIGASLLETLSPEKDLSERGEIIDYLKHANVLDFRGPQEFAHSHFKDAVNVPLGPSTANWLAGVMPEGRGLLCVLPHANEKDPIQGMIRMLGYDQPLAFMTWDDKLDLSGLTTGLEMISPAELKALLKEPENIFLVDVRTPMEWNGGHLEEAHYIELNAIEKSLKQIPASSRIIVICGSGWRSSIIASLLKKEGFSKVSHVWGGMQEVKNCVF